ncbi:FAD-dependent monooxygenase [Propioniciclava coleopterorum]|uniref:FAD-dependent monooxygenase n=1 Tax=Propioniciclava coleopterorum TaxID=2714937 RepID=A0A6G7Y9E7_9ACTN|nr:NAD(P)/FAD-dependent oxidoreductase [Propioniciclava coleopterorum]QIK73237.1 FAD-dependent monooxygenase [Propioniciclava coleopterorum]
MRVVICGGGMGGLVLAHALGEHADVLVLDRDASASDTGGYRISIDDAACRALGTALTRSLLEEVRATADTGDAYEQFTIADARLRPLIVAPLPPHEDRILAHRPQLRALLARDLGARIRFGCRVVSVTQHRSIARVTLADGSELDADLVVAADGADSVAARSLPGRTPARDLGLVGVAGWAPLDGVPPAFLFSGPALAFGAEGLGVFLSLSRGPAAAQGARPGLIWGTISRSEAAGPAPGMPPEQLRRAALRLLRSWSPWLNEQVARSDPARTAAFRLWATDPGGDLGGWPPGPVAALGDAVHAMPPTGGQGASTAIRDAVELAAAVREGRRGADLGPALAAYQRSVATRGRAAIRESLGPVRVLRALGHRPAQLLAAPLLRLAGAVGIRLHPNQA